MCNYYQKKDQLIFCSPCEFLFLSLYFQKKKKWTFVNFKFEETAYLYNSKKKRKEILRKQKTFIKRIARFRHFSLLVAKLRSKATTCLAVSSTTRITLNRVSRVWLLALFVGWFRRNVRAKKPVSADRCVAYPQRHIERVPRLARALPFVRVFPRWNRRIPRRKISPREPSHRDYQINFGNLQTVVLTLSPRKKSSTRINAVTGVYRYLSQRENSLRRK